MCHTTLVLFFHFSYGDIIWPGLDLDLFLALVSYLHGIFFIPSKAFWQSLGLQSPAWPRQPIRPKRVSFDLWPALDPTFDLSRKILRLHQNPLVESFRSPICSDRCISRCHSHASICLRPCMQSLVIAIYEMLQNTTIERRPQDHPI